MKESEMIKTMCPHFAIMAQLKVLCVLINPDPPATKDLALDIINDLDMFNCRGSGCAMWESEYEKETKEVTGIRIDRGDVNESFSVINAVSAMPEIRPEGDDWRVENVDPNYISPNKTKVVKARFVRWVPTDRGDCGLKSKEQGCFYP